MASQSLESVKMAKSILFVEDDLALRKSLALEFCERGYDVKEASTLESLPQNPVDYAVVDLRLGDQNGLCAVEYLRSQFPQCRIVVLTGYGSIATAVEAIKLGAYQYLTKPFSVDVLDSILNGQKTESTAESMLSLQHWEHEYVQFVLRQNDGNVSKAARVLGIHRQSLQRKLKKTL